MSSNEEESPTEATGPVVVPAKLSPVDAEALREAALAALTAADGELSIDVDGDEPSVCALQILIAAKRSADAKGLNVALSESAEAALANVEMH